MIENTSIMKEISFLVLMSLEGNITIKDRDRLEHLLLTSPSAREYYFDTINIHIGINSADVLMKLSDNSYKGQDSSIWKALSDYEKIAPSIEIEKPVEEEDDKQVHAKVKIESPKRTINKFSLFTAILSAAALFCILLSLQLFPQKPLVATIVKSKDFQWQNKKLHTENGSFLPTGDYTIEKGSLDIQLLQGANVSITAPSTFKLVSEKEIFLDQGRLYAQVPEQAQGFVVNTISGKVTDLGTEFGVYIGSDISKAEIAVIRGKVKVNKQTNGSSIEKTIEQGNAYHINKSNSTIKSIGMASSEFASEALTAYEHNIKQSEPVAYWNFNNIESDTLTNIYGNTTYTGQIRKGVTIEIMGNNNSENSNLKALNFDGHTASSVLIKNDNIFNPEDKSFTVSLWFKSDPLDNAFGGSFLISKRSLIKTANIDQKFWGWSIIVNGDDLFIQTNSGSDDDFYGVWLNNFDCLNDQWHNVVMVIDRENDRLLGYLDGSTKNWAVTLPKDKQLYADNKITVDHLLNTCRDKYTKSDKIYNEGPLRISGRKDDVDDKTSFDYCAPFKGLVYDIAIWKRALSSDEIRALFNSNPLCNKLIKE